MLDKDKSEMRNALRAQLDIRMLLKQMKLKEIMTVKVVSIPINAPFSEVPKKFNMFNIRHLPVVDARNKLVGLMTQRDLYKIHSPRKLEDGSWYYDEDELNDYILEDVMIRNPLAMNTEDCVGDALLEMVRNKYGCILIINSNQELCGIVTRVDILKMAARIYSS